MVNERPKQFGGVSRFGGPSRPGFVRPPASSSSTIAASPAQSRAQKLGLGLGKGSGGSGKEKSLKRHMEVRKVSGGDLDGANLTTGRHSEIRSMVLRGAISGELGRSPRSFGCTSGMRDSKPVRCEPPHLRRNDTLLTFPQTTSSAWRREAYGSNDLR